MRLIEKVNFQVKKDPAGENKQQQALEKTKTQAEYDSKRECAAHDMQSLHLPICDNVIDDIDGKQGHG